MLDIYILEALGFVVAFIFAMAGLSNVRYVKYDKDNLAKLIVGLFMAVFIIFVDISFIIKNNVTFYNRKPQHCLKNDIHCLERLLDWKKDSVKYNYQVPIKTELDTARILDSLKHELEKY